MATGYDSLANGETSRPLSAWCTSSSLCKRALYKPVKKGPFVLSNLVESDQQTHVDDVQWQNGAWIDKTASMLY